MNKELLIPVIYSLFRHVITAYGGSKLFSADFNSMLAGVVSIIVAVGWSYLEKRKKMVKSDGNEPKP